MNLVLLFAMIAAQEPEGPETAPPQPAPAETPIERETPQPSLDPGVLYSPLDLSHADGGAALLWVPVARSAYVPAVGSSTLSAGIDLARENESITLEGGRNRFDATLYEEFLELRSVPEENFEVFVRFVTGRLDEEELVLFDEGRAILSGLDPHFGAKELTFGIRHQAFDAEGYTFGALAGLKLPVSRSRNFLATDTYDLAAAIIASRTFHPFSVHINLGAVYPFGQPDLFESNDHVNPFLFATLALTVTPMDDLCLVIQYDGSSTPFRDIAYYDQPTGSLAGGIRIGAPGGWALGISAAYGLTDVSANFSFHVGIEQAF